MAKSKLDMPAGIIARKQRSGKTYFYLQTKLIKGKRKEYPLGDDKKLAIEKYNNIIATKDINIPRENKTSLKYWDNKSLCAIIYKRAKNKNIDCTLTIEEIDALLEKSGGKCALTGIKFDMLNDKQYRTRPWIPSIDRIDNTRGYTIDNVRLIANAVNLALNEFGDDVFYKIAEGLILNMYGRRSKIGNLLRENRRRMLKTRSAPHQPKNLKT